MELLVGLFLSYFNIETEGKGKFEKYQKFQYIMSIIADTRIFQKNLQMIYKGPIILPPRQEMLRHFID